LLMRDALLKDIAGLHRYDIVTCHDARIQAPALAQKSVAVTKNQFDQVFDDLLLEADMLWLVAPETDGILQNLTQRCVDRPVMLIGCGVQAVNIASYKTLTAEALQAAGIPTLPVFSAKNWLARFEADSALLAQEAWIAKPEDGAGCDGIYLFEKKEQLADWLRAGNASEKHICQPYQQGIAASFCMLCKSGQAWLLSVNLQHLVQEERALKLCGIKLNAFEDPHEKIMALANKIAQMLPDALGYIGVDIVIAPDINDIFVIEINPRLTTSYVGLGEATGQNMAELILNFVLEPNFSCPNLEKNKVEITFG
jgi:predicted ATP-grasp superfamily ATP-dependent carboligase